jgi:hypothetical protein
VRRAPAAALIAALAVVAVAGCGGGGGGGAGAHDRGAPAPRSDADQLTALLDRRARALTQREAGPLLATDGSPGLRRADRTRVTRLRSLPVRPFRYETGELSVSGERASIHTAERYRVRGVPGSLFTLRRRYAATKRDGRWRLTSERPGRERQPWELAPQRALRRRHFLVLAPRGVDPDAAGLPGALERAHRAVARAIPGRIGSRYLVTVAASTAQARRLAGHIGGIESLVAVADSDVSEQGAARRPIDVISQRLVLIWPQYSQLDQAGRVRILTHELTHLATASFTSGLTPSWLVEGLALYVSGDRRVDEAARLLGSVVLGGARGRGATDAHRSLALAPLSGPQAIARLAGAGQGAAYAYASAAAFYIADRYGPARLFRLYRVFNADDLPGGAGTAVTDAAVRRVLHLPLARLERNLRAWILARALVAPDAP